MEGLITAFSGTSLTVNMTYVVGTASFSLWTITNSGAVGTSGYSGYSGISGYSGFSGISGYSGYSGTPAGSTGQIQYNNAGSFGASPTLIYSSSGQLLTVGTSGTALTSINQNNTNEAAISFWSNNIATPSSTNNFIVGMDTTANGGGGFVWNRNNSYLKFGTNNTEKTRISAGGNLLVGTTSDPTGGATSNSIVANGAVYANNGTTGGFYSSTFATNTSNNIWAFGNAVNYGLKYFQGTAGTNSIDTISMPFGQSTSSASYFQFISNGSNIGALVMPSQPRFMAAIAATSDATFNSGSYLPFNSTFYNDSGSYSTSNYYFTAPVAGKYMFFFNIFFTSSAGSTYGMQVGTTLNGSFINVASGDAAGCLYYNPTSYIGEFTGTIVMNMAIGDKVGIQPRTSSIRVYQGHCSFGGYLIG
jgi:hypothetical protein